MKENKKEIFDNVEPGTYVYARHPKWIGKNEDHRIRPFFIVGSDENNLYGLYCTTSQNKKGIIKRTVECKNDKAAFKESSIIGYEIYTITIDDFYGVYYFAPEEFCKRVISKLSVNLVDPSKVNYKFFNFLFKPNCICLYDDKFYIFKGFVPRKDLNELILVPLTLEKTSEDKIKLNNKIYYTDNKNKIILPWNYFEKVKVIGMESDFKPIKKFCFGDILSLKESKEKIVFITCIGDTVYYCNNDSEIFLGLSKINLNKTNQKINELNSQDKKRLSDRINRYLNANESKIDERVVNKIRGKKI